MRMVVTTSDVEILIATAGIIAIGVIGKRAGWFKIISGTNALLREQNAILTEQNITLKTQLETTTKLHIQDKTDWAQRHSESLTQIAKLQGKVETLTALPLSKIDETLKEFTAFGQKFVESNDKILEQLKMSAKTLAIDTQDAATHVKEVQVSLEENK